MDWTPTIDSRSGPMYLRIVGALSDDIAAGRLREGQMLPTHRTLAARLGVDLTTVTRAYREAQRLGLTDARVGRGTFVKTAQAGQRRAAAAQPVIDLSMNIPPQPAAADLSARLVTAFADLRAEAGLEAHLNYQHPGGTQSERAIAAEWLGFLVPGLAVERMVIAPGTQAALFALLMLLAPGGSIFTEALTYPGLKAAAAALGVRLIGVETDAQGIVPKALQSACRAHPDTKLLYLMPTMHNPTTATLPPERRERVAQIIRRQKLTLIEDDPYAFLTSGIVPLAAMVPERTYLTASLSKCVTPGLRASLVVTPGREASGRLVNALRATLQMPAAFATAIAVRWLRDGTADAIIKAIRAEAAARQKLAREALAGHDFAADAHGHHGWLTLPATWSEARFAAQLQNRGIGVVTSDAFAVAGSGGPAVRIALGAASSRANLMRALDIVRETLVAGGYDNQVV